MHITGLFIIGFLLYRTISAGKSEQSISLYIQIHVYFMLGFHVDFFFDLTSKEEASSISILLISGSPVSIYETFIRGLMDVYSFLNDKFDISVPRYLQWFEAERQCNKQFFDGLAGHCLFHGVYFKDF